MLPSRRGPFSTFQPVLQDIPARFTRHTVLWSHRSAFIPAAARSPRSSLSYGRAYQRVLHGMPCSVEPPLGLQSNSIAWLVNGRNSTVFIAINCIQQLSFFLI
jgi:hypothetical protein